MKRKQVIIMIVVAAVLAAVVWLLNRGEQKTWSGGAAASAAGGKVLEFPINDVAQITIQTASGTLNLARKEETWVVQERGDYPAAFDRVSNLLRSVWALKAVQEVNAGPSQFPRFEIADPPQGSAAKLEFKDSGAKQLGALILGKKHTRRADGAMPGGGEFPTGRYVMQPGGSRVLLVSEMFDAVEAKPESWIDREFIKIENPSAIALAGATDAQKWKLVRENATAEWKLEGAPETEKPDAAKMTPITGGLSRMMFADVLGKDANPGETGLENPTTLTVETFDGFRYVLRIGKPMGDNQPVSVEVNANFAAERTPAADEKPEDKARLDAEFSAKQKPLQEKLAREKKLEGRVFLVAKTTIDQVVKERAALLAQPSPSPSPATPAAPAPPGVTTSPVAAGAGKGASPTPAAKPKR